MGIHGIKNYSHYYPFQIQQCIAAHNNIWLRQSLSVGNAAILFLTANLGDRALEEAWFLAIANFIRLNGALNFQQMEQLMSDVAVYMIANLVVHNVDEYRIYEKGFFPILKKFDGEFVTFDDNHQTLEGTDPIEGRVIMFKFPSEQAAKDWYNDDEYQALSEFRRAGTTLKSLTMVHALPPRS